MRVLELRAGALSLELHPRITVLTGLAADERAEVAELLGGLARGLLPDHVNGLAEAHGLVFGLSAGSVAALGLPAELDAVFGRGDVPLAGPDAEARQAERAAHLARLRAGEDRAALEGQLVTARDAHRRAAAEAAAAAERASRAAAVLESARGRAQALEAAAARAAEEAAEAAAAEVAAEEARGAALERLEARRTELHETLGADVERARIAARRAKNEVAAAEAAGAPLTLTAEDAAALDAAHAEVEEAEDRISRARIPNPLAHRRLRAAQEREQEVLDRLGIPSYGAYLIRSSTMHVDPDAAAKLAAARAAQEEAEATFGALEERLESELEALDREADALRAPEDRRGPSEAPAASGDVERLAAELDAAERDAVDRREAEAAAAERVAELEARAGELDEALARAETALERAVEAVAASASAGASGEPDPEEIEVYLLARLAGLRAAGSAGAVPVVIDDALTDLGPLARNRLLSLVDRIADAVQAVYLTDSAEIASWGESLGSDRCLVVRR